VTFLLNQLARVTSSLTLVVMLGACGGGDVPLSSPTSVLAPDKCSAYVNLPGQLTRFNASAFPECTSLRTNADTYLAAAINACVEGDIIAADNYYGRYRQLIATVCLR
jgi:hypothetical protein